MNTMTTQFLHSNPAMYTSPGRTYARVGVRDPARMYTYVAVFSLLHPDRCTYMYMLRARLYYDTCAPLLPHVPFLTRPRFITSACRQTDRMYVHARDQNDNATYASTRWVPTVRHFLACEDVAGGPSSQGANHFFPRNMDALPCVRRCSRWVPAVRGETFFSRNTVARPMGPFCQVEKSLFSV